MVGIDGLPDEDRVLRCNLREVIVEIVSLVVVVVFISVVVPFNLFFFAILGDRLL